MHRLEVERALWFDALGVTGFEVSAKEVDVFYPLNRRSSLQLNLQQREFVCDLLRGRWS
jgi:hypothetical protein